MIDFLESYERSPLFLRQKRCRFGGLARPAQVTKAMKARGCGICLHPVKSAGTAIGEIGQRHAIRIHEVFAVSLFFRIQHRMRKGAEIDESVSPLATKSFRLRWPDSVEEWREKRIGSRLDFNRTSATNFTPVHSRLIFRCPMLRNCPCRMRQPITIFSAGQDLNCREILWRVRGGFSKRRQQLGRDQWRDVMLLETEQHRHFGRIQSRRQSMTIQQRERILQ